MKTILLDVLIILIITTALILVTGCTSRKALMQERMDPLVGVLTYDQALMSMGPPTTRPSERL